MPRVRIGRVLCIKECIMEAFDRLKQLVADAEMDLERAERGNKAAGTRVRKAMQDVKKAVQDVRVKILEMRA